MDTRRNVTIDLPETLLLALGRAARAAGCSPSDYLRAALAAALEPRPARPVSAEGRILHAVRLAADWVDLQHRLREAGFVLRRVPGEGLTLHTWPVERAVLPLSALGFGETDLTLRFGVGFPADAPHGAGRCRADRQARAA
ncbi:MAG: hypothetical protein ACK4NE_02920 [Albidovulum sp.]